MPTGPFWRTLAAPGCWPGVSNRGSACSPEAAVLVPGRCGRFDSSWLAFSALAFAGAVLLAVSLNGLTSFSFAAVRAFRVGSPVRFSAEPSVAAPPPLGWNGALELGESSNWNADWD